MSSSRLLKKNKLYNFLLSQVAWIHIDRQMILTIHRHVITRLARFSVSHDNAMTWLLHVSQVQQEDRGYYMCQVNTNPMISQVGYLQVVGKLHDFWFFGAQLIYNYFLSLVSGIQICVFRAVLLRIHFLN